MGRGTREKIMTTAIDMFNKKGATNVSTVQLSNELNISPGNLYYYFDNKEHLIRSIWLEMLTPKTSELFYFEGLETRVEVLMDIFLQLSQYTYSFRFFYQELSAMLINDPDLKDLYKERSIKLMARMDELIDLWIENGIMKPGLSPIAKKYLINNCWILSQNSITYVTLLEYSDSAKAACDHIIQHVYALIHPYLSEESHQIMLKLFAENDLGFHNE